jgi:serine/threonine protein kinase
MSCILFRPSQQVRDEHGEEFTIQEWAGEGSYARVYRAVGRGGTVALKLAKAEVEGAVERLLREREARDCFTHPAIPALLGSGHAAGADCCPVDAPWLALRWVDGESLKRRLERTRGLPLSQTVAILTPVVDAVAALHTAGWVHGDLRPENVLLEAGTRHAYLLDLGEARRSPPERPQADLRQLGELLAWCLTAVNPATEPERLARSSGYPPTVVQLWREAIEDRLPDARDFRARLLRLARQIGLPAKV